MDYQLDRQYFGMVIPEDLGSEYSKDGWKFGEALSYIVENIETDENLDMILNIKLSQRGRGEAGSTMSYFPCYLGVLHNIPLHLPPKYYEDLIRLACRYQAGEESQILVTVTSDEHYCASWLKFAIAWSGALIQETRRTTQAGRTKFVYTLLFPEGKMMHNMQEATSKANTVDRNAVLEEAACIVELWPAAVSPQGGEAK